MIGVTAVVMIQMEVELKAKIEEMGRPVLTGVIQRSRKIPFSTLSASSSPSISTPPTGPTQTA